MTNIMLEVALKYLALGWSVIPIQPKSKSPLLDWKKYQTVRATEAEVREWFKKYPTMNIGIVTGKISGIVVVDVDSPKGGRITLPGITTTATTGSGGKHYIYTCPDEEIPNSASKVAKYVDIRGEGGMIVVAPSVHPNGNEYVWELSPWDTPPAQLPKELLTLLHTPKTNKRTDWGSFLKKDAPEGTRNDSAIKYAGKLVREYKENEWETKAYQRLVKWNNERCKPPLDEDELSTVFNSACSMRREQIENDPQEGNKSQASRLVELVFRNPDIELFKDDFNTAYVAYPVGTHKECWKVSSGTFKRWLSASFYAEYGAVPSAGTFNDALQVIEAKVFREGNERKLYTRFAHLGNTIWYDLCDAEWRAVKITKDGWSIESNPPTIFKRYPHQSPQVAPEVGGRTQDILRYINVQKGDQEILTLVWLVTSFLAGFPHPIMYIYGPQGSAKSTFSRILREIVDPARLEVLSMSNKHDELIQILAHHQFVFFDNVSFFSHDMSDLLCKAVTGMGFSKRTLYTDDDATIYNVSAVIGINGINLVASKPDLLERTILMSLERVAKEHRKQEDVILSEYKASKPKILGAIFAALSKALSIKPTVKLKETPRMADFASWGCAIAEALGYKQKEFIDAYARNQDSQKQQVIDESPLVGHVVGFMKDKTTWQGTAQQLHSYLFTSLDFYDRSRSKDLGVPKNANTLGRQLNDLKVTFEEIGIKIGKEHKDNVRIITITKNPVSVVPVVQDLPSGNGSEHDTEEEEQDDR